jgi:hypothetical protein
MNTQGFDASEFVKGRWLHGADLQPGQPLELTIATVGVHEFEDGTKRPKVEFLEVEQALSLNKTQTGAMIQLFGANTGAWAGQRITLMPIPTQFQGKPTIAIGRAAPPQPPTAFGQPSADNPFAPLGVGAPGVTFRQPG